MLTPEQKQMYREKYNLGSFSQSPESSSPAESQLKGQSLIDHLHASKSMASNPVQEKEADTMDTLGKVGEVTGDIFGGNKIGDLIGSKAAKYLSKGGRDLRKQVKEGKISQEEYDKTFEGPSGKEILGDIAKSALNFVPIGKLGKGIELGAEALGAAKAAPAIGKIAAGAATGYGMDVAENLRKNKKGADIAKPGTGALLGGAGEAGLQALEKGMSFVPKGSEIALNSLIKPLLKDFSYGKNPGRAVAEEGIIANSFEDLANKIGTRKKEIGSQIGDIVNSNEANAERMNLTESLKPIDEAIQEALRTPRTNKGVVQRLMDTKADILGEITDEAGNTTFATKMDDITPKEAFDMKQLVADLTRFTDNQSDDTIVNKALKQVYGNIKTDLNNTLKKTGFTDIEKLNEKYADLTSAEIATKYRDKLHARQNLISLDNKAAGGLAAMTTFLASGGSVAPAALAGIAIDKLVKSPMFITRAAALLAKADQNAVKVFFDKYPDLANAIRKGALQASTGLENE